MVMIFFTLFPTPNAFQHQKKSEAVIKKSCNFVVVHFSTSTNLIIAININIKKFFFFKSGDPFILVRSKSGNMTVTCWILRTKNVVESVSGVEQISSMNINKIKKYMIRNHPSTLHCTVHCTVQDGYCNVCRAPQVCFRHPLPRWKCVYNNC